MFKFLFAAFSIFSVTAMGAPAHAEDPMSFFEDVECDEAGCTERYLIAVPKIQDASCDVE